MRNFGAAANVHRKPCGFSSIGNLPSNGTTGKNPTRTPYSPRDLCIIAYFPKEYKPGICSKKMRAFPGKIDRFAGAIPRLWAGAN